MPLVVVTLNRVFAIKRKEFGEMLCRSVASALYCKEDRLRIDEVEVRFREAGPDDINSKDLMIDILANEYPERRANLHQSTETIAKDVRKWLGQHGFLQASICGGENGNFVYLLLANGAFVEL